MKFDTKTIHAGVEPDPATGSIMTPIYQTSTFVQEAPGAHKGYEYSRQRNPTRTVLEENVAALEKAAHGVAFASGLAAVDAVLKLLRPGDEVVSTNDLYGGTYRQFMNVFSNFGLVFRFCNMEDPDTIREMLTQETRMIWIETPSNPMMNVIDIEAVSAIAKERGIMVVVDNTFATPYLQNPLELGADVVIHSATKYLGGHSDVVLGLAATKDQELGEKISFLQNSCGAVPGPQDCFLVLRGIKTLHLRMDRHCENGAKVAQALRKHPAVEKVNWPGFEDHSGHATAQKQMKDFGGMVSFSLKGNQQEDAFKVMQATRYFALAESLGGVESLIGHPASMTHAAIPKVDRERSGVVDSLIRLSVGIEDGDDLVADLEQALNVLED